MNSRSVRRAVLLAALLFAAPAAAGAFSSSDLKGEWHGRLAQKGMTLAPLTASALHYRFVGGGVVSAGIIRRVR